MRPTVRSVARIFFLALCCVSFFWEVGPIARPRVAESTTLPPNSDASYQQLRQIGLGSEAFTVQHLVLKRDAATFTFESGTLVFLAPVNGKVTGAVFSGEGTLSITPPISIEQKSLSLLTRQSSLFDTFNELVLRFTDDTYQEIKTSNATTPTASANVSFKYFEDIRNGLRKDHHYNLDARVLQDVLTTQAGGLFIAFLKSARYGNRLAYWTDPRGTPHGMAPEEAQLATFDESRFGVWAAYHYSREYQDGVASGKQNNSVLRITGQELDTQILPSGELPGKAVSNFVSQVNGLRAVPFDLFPSLRVQSVTGPDGQPLPFMQEDQHADSDFWVILSNDLNAGQEFSVTTTYGGKDAVVDEGGANYYPVACGNWYPSRRGWGDFSTYDMNFTIPKGMQLVATGSPLGDDTAGKSLYTKWISDKPQPVAGFQFDKFKSEETKIPRLDNFEVVSYANQEMPATFGGLQKVPMLGNINTTSLVKKAMAEAELAVQLYTDYFGSNGFKRLAMTRQTATNYGQSWPEMVYLPITYFFDTTVRHQLGMDAARGYFQVVAPHEVAHQWWGHTVSWASYRDQWMSEGFSDFSASLYIQIVWKDRPQDFVNFWNDERDLLTK
jgi:Peptidase family M1 domain